MSFINNASELKNRLNAFKEHEFLYLGDYLVESLVEDIDETVSSMRTGFGEYFNEYGLPSPEMGEGMHFMTGSGYSSSIPKSFDYFKVRDLMLNNLTSYTADETLFFKNVRVKLDRFENETLPEWERMYDDYNRHPPIIDTGSTGGDSSGDSTEPSGPPIPSAEDFWTRYNLKEEFGSFMTELGTILYNCRQACKSMKSELGKWLDLGSEVSTTIALAQYINGLPSEVYSKLSDGKGSVGVYSKKMQRALVTTDKIKTRYPDSSIVKQNMCLRDVVCNQLNVKSRSESILNNLKSIFSQFGISGR